MNETEHGARRRRRENIKIKGTLLCDSGTAYGTRRRRPRMTRERQAYGKHRINRLRLGPTLKLQAKEVRSFLRNHKLLALRQNLVSWLRLVPIVSLSSAMKGLLQDKEVQQFYSTTCRQM